MREGIVLFGLNHVLNFMFISFLCKIYRYLQAFCCSYMNQEPYRRIEKLRLYRALLKGAFNFPLRSRRDVVTQEVKGSFRNPTNELLDDKAVDYKLVLGWERAAAITKYAENMYWFHSRDEVTKEMLHHSQRRDEERRAESERCNQVGEANVKTPEVTKFFSSFYNVHPDYYGKIGSKPLTHSRDVWRAKGQYGSDMGGPRQKFYVRRFKAHFPQGW